MFLLNFYGGEIFCGNLTFFADREKKNTKIAKIWKERNVHVILTKNLSFSDFEIHHRLKYWLINGRPSTVFNKRGGAY